MTLDNKKYELYMDYILSILLTIIPKIVLIILKAYPMRVTGDELFLFYLPAKLAGLDWSECMYNYRYYGYGFSIFLTPLFKIIDDPVVLYRIVLIIIAVLQSIIPIVSCYLLRNYFKIRDQRINILITISCAYCVSLYNTYMYNEHIYIIYVWLSFLCVAKLTNNDDKKKKKVFWSVVLALSFIGALTIHQRAITLILGYVILYILCKLLLKKNIGYFSIVSGIYFLGYLIDKKIVEWNINFLKYDAPNSEINVQEIGNTNVSDMISFKGKFWENKEFLEAACDVIISNLNSWNIFTMGLAAFSVVLCVVYFIKILRQEIDEIDNKVIVLGIFSIVCIFITLVGLTNSWGWGIKDAYIQNDYDADALRGLVYLRYYIAYYPPCMLAILALIYKKKYIYSNNFRYTCIFSYLLMSFWLKNIVDFVQNNSATMGSMQAYAIGINQKDSVDINTYLWGTVVVVTLFIVITRILKDKKIEVYLLLLCLCFLYQYSYKAISDGKNIEINYLYSDASSRIIEEIQTEEVDIYIDNVDFKETSQSYIYQVQFMNMKHTLKKGKPEKLSNNILFFTIVEKEYSELYEMGYKRIKIDNNEYVYAKEKELINELERICENKK